MGVNIMETAQTEPAILVVEDDAVLRGVMAELLTLYGCRVDVASDTYRAATLLDRCGYDVVLSDVQLPGHGLSTLDHAHRAQPDTPVILITSLRRPALRRRAFASGAFEVLEKPLTGPELRAAIERALHADGNGSNGGGGHAAKGGGGASNAARASNSGNGSAGRSAKRTARRSAAVRDGRRAARAAPDSRTGSAA